MAKIKIEIKKPQYLEARKPGIEIAASPEREKSPIFFKLLLIATYALSGLAIWYAYQRFSNHL